MHEFITLRHQIPHFDVTSDTKFVESTQGAVMVKTCGRLDINRPLTCPDCGAVLHSHAYEKVFLRDLPIMGCLHGLETTYERHMCSHCGKVFRDIIPFKSDKHFITDRLEKLILQYLSYGFTNKAICKLTGVHAHIIKDIEKSKLEKKYDLDNLKNIESVRYLAVDEISIHSHHKYATVFMNLENGHVIYCEAGKTKDQVIHFIKKVSKKWLKGLVAVSMDMNAQYDSAFKQAAPQVEIVYDYFHMLKLYGDSVLTKIRRRLQNQAKENGDSQLYSVLKGSRYILLSDRDTLQEKDQIARQNNSMIKETYEDKCLPIPPGKRKMKASNEKKLDTLLSINKDLETAYILKEQFKLAYDKTDPEKLRKGLYDWCTIAQQSNIPELLKFEDTIISHIEGIINHAKFKISTSRLEGTNNLAKVIKRTAYGFHDDKYYFLKLMDASRRPYQELKSHRFLH